MPLKVALITGYPVFQAGVRTVLSRDDTSVVAECAEPADAYAVVDAAHPDVVLLDISLAGPSGMTTARELLRRDPGRRILVIDVRAEESTAAEALAAGALGLFSKDQPIEDLLQALRTVAESKTYLPPQVSQKAVEARLRLRRSGPLGILSTREREVFDLLVRGLTNEEVAHQLTISRRTVETHRSRILKKLNVHSVVELIRLAARHGLLGT
jgi:DNA-binding NarL/FixJ family response regulator